MLETLKNMTINNPIFIFVLITIIWFLPGMVLRRINEKKFKNAKASSQAKAIAKLYPKQK